MSALLLTLARLRVLFLFTLAELPLRDGEDPLFRWRLVEAADTAAEGNEHDAKLLLRIARYESLYRSDVADCRVTGDSGRARSSWQIHARAPWEAKALCTSLVGGARIALERVRESAQMCRFNRGSAVLNGFTAGRCDRGSEASALRWVEE